MGRKKEKKPRAYEPIWLHLKAHGSCKVRVPRKLAGRVKKAVIKEKYMDEKYKLLYTSELKIEIQDKGWPVDVVIVFTLNQWSKYL